MGRKVVWTMAILAVAVVSAGLVGGQVGGGFLWWGDHEPIYIYGDEDFTYRNGVMSGSGTVDDPYIIEGWRVDAPNADYGIYIDHTTRHFVIRDCVIERAEIAGVYLNSVRNGRLANSQISLSDTAVYLLNSRENRLDGNLVADCDYGVVMQADSQGNTITGNSFLNNGLSGYDPQLRNRWYDGDRGNYWSEYTGSDANGDGIGDEPYYPLWDSRPLMSSPVELTEVRPAGPAYAGNMVAPDGSLVVNSQTPITLTSQDPGSGLAEIRYSVDGGEWNVYKGPILLKGEDGPKRLTYYGIDYLGNMEPKKSVSFLLDNHPPITVSEIGGPNYTNERGIWVTSATQITLRRTQESTYGRAKTYYRIDGGSWRLYSSPFVLYGGDGPRRIEFYSQNASGVAEATQTLPLFKDDAPPSTRGAQASSSIGVGVGTAVSAVPAATPSPVVSIQTPVVVPPVVEVPVEEPIVEETLALAVPATQPQTPSESASVPQTPSETVAGPSAPLEEILPSEPAPELQTPSEVVGS